MAVVVDASSPAIVNGTGASPITSASFTPPTGSYVVAVACAGFGGVATIAISDSLSGTWTSRVTSNDTTSGNGACVQISTRVIASSAAMTVTATYTNNGGGRMLGVYVLTSADTTTVGASAVKPLVSGTAMTKSLTTTVAGSLVLGGVDSTNQSTASLASNTSWASMTGSNPVSQATDGVAYGIIKGSSVTGTPGATTFGVNWSSSTFGQMALLEIKPSTNSNIAAADSSSPAANNAVVQANIVGADTGTGTDTAAVSTAISASDTGTGTEAVPKITVLAADASIGDEATKVLSGGATLAFASDVATGTESTVVRMTAADSMATIEASTAAVQGPLPPGPRIVRVLPDTSSE